MAFDYTEARATALELISEFGSSATVYTNGETTTNALGQTVVVAGQSIDGTATPLLYYSSDSKLSQYEKDNIKAGDAYIFFHSDTAPEMNMLHDANGATWRVFGVNSLSSRDDVNVIQKLMLRK